MVGDAEVDVDHGRRLADADQRELVEVALHRAAVLDRDFLRHQFRESVDDRALHLISRHARVDDLPADIANHPHLVHAQGVVVAQRDLGDLREVAAMAVVARHAHGRGLGVLPLRPAGPLRDRAQHARHPLGAETILRRLAARHRQQVEAELQRIFAGGVRQFIDERLIDPRDGVAARSAEGAGGHTQRDQRGMNREVRHEAVRKFGVGNIGRGRERVGRVRWWRERAVADEVTAPRRDRAVGVESTLQVMEPAGTVEVVAHVVFACPQQFDRRAANLL